MTGLRGTALVALLLIASRCENPSLGPVTDIESAEAYVDRWLAAVAIDARSRGFEALHPALRSDMAPEQYLESFNGSFDGDGVRWEIADGSDRDGSADASFYMIGVNVEGGSEAFPEGLFESGLMQRLTLDQRDVGIVVIVKVDGVGSGIWIP